MLTEFIADLHIHTCLSPCADLDMTPDRIVRVAKTKGIDIIAITDHNSAENIPAAIKASEGSYITVLAGMEITTAEEAHILALFGNMDAVLKMQDKIYKHLLPGENNPERFGEQIIVNENDEVMGISRRLLISATSLETAEIVKTVKELGGISVASHIDKQAFSIISQLGFIPQDIEFDALEISKHTDMTGASALFADYKHTTWISSSDAHFQEEIGQRTTRFYLNAPTFEEISLALCNKDGRKAEWG